MRRTLMYKLSDGTITKSYQDALNDKERTGHWFETILHEDTNLMNDGDDMFGRDMLTVLKGNRLKINDLTCPW